MGLLYYIHALMIEILEILMNVSVEEGLRCFFLYVECSLHKECNLQKVHKILNSNTFVN